MTAPIRRKALQPAKSQPMLDDATAAGTPGTHVTSNILSERHECAIDRVLPESAPLAGALRMKIYHAALTGFLVLATVASAQAEGPTDAQIAAIVVTADQVDIDAGTLALSKAQSPQVKEFAQLMITDHTAVNKAAVELVQKLHVTPESSETSRSLQKGGDENLAALKKLSGSAFDRAYVDHEVAYHQAVLNAIDSTLIPSAQNPELKALLVKVRPAFAAHLDHANQLQSTLNKNGG
jgi:putative membrane protein